MWLASQHLRTVPASPQTGMVEMSEAFKHKGAEVYLEPAALS